MSNINPQNVRNIAKNTLFLYLRQFFILLVSLYTGRLVLGALGESDFGIYNIVGTVIVLFSFLQGALTTSVERYMNCSLGKGEANSFHKVFVMSLNANLILAAVILVLSETAGLWILEKHLVIPEERMVAARYVFHLSVANCCLSIIRTPYHAAIISHEKMDVFAYLGLVEVLLKLGIVFLLVRTDGDKLIFYAILLFVVTILLSLIYVIFCHLKIDGARFSRYWDGKLLKELLFFSGWNLFGSMANVGTAQGINIFLNKFFGVTINAAMGVMNKVVSAINSFCTNFQTAFVPQLMKSYAENDKDYFFYLIFRTSKFSFFLLYVIALPFIFYCNDIMNLWLVEVPQYAVEFTQLSLIFYLIDAMSAPFWNSVQATGKIKNYQILISLVIIGTLPISFLFLKKGYSPESVLIIRIIINLAAHIVRLFYVKKLFGFPIGKYLKEIVSRIVIVVVISLPVPLILSGIDMQIIGKCLSLLAVIFTTAMSIFFVGMKKSERETIIKKVKSYAR